MITALPVKTATYNLRLSYFLIRYDEGCFNETQIDQSVNKTLTSTSVVMCQQKCSIEHCTFFGLQNTSCVCLSNHFSVTKAIDPLLCSTSCSISEVLNDCGGPGTYSVYKAGDLVFLEDHGLNAIYMALKCSEKTSTFLYLQSSTLAPKCQCRRPGTELNDTVYPNWNWNDCYENCKKEARYLHGDYDVMDPVCACHGIQTRSVETWVGIARQNFISFSLDLSYSLQLQCETCHQSTCSFTSCSHHNHALCKQKVLETTTKLTISSSLAPTSQTSTRSSLAPTNQASSDSSNLFLNDDNKDNQIELGKVLLGVGGTIVAVLAVIGLIVFYARRRKRNSLKRGQSSFRGQSHGASDDPINKTNGYSNFELIPVERGHQNISQDNVSYDCLSEANKKKHGVNLHIYTSSAPSYSVQNFHEESSYDHLWQTPTSDQADDTYNHGGGVTNHGFTATVDDYYSHTDCVTNIQSFATVDDTYNHACDVTNEGFGAKADDTYDHAGGTTNHGVVTFADDYYNHSSCATADNFYNNTVLDDVSYLATTDDTYS